MMSLHVNLSADNYMQHITYSVVAGISIKNKRYATGFLFLSPSHLPLVMYTSLVYFTFNIAVSNDEKMVNKRDKDLCQHTGAVGILVFLCITKHGNG